jgi:hypothetical protein
LNREGIPFTTYTHVYEVDSEPLDASKVLGPRAQARRWALRQNLGRSSVYWKLDKLLERFRFGSVEDYLRDAGYL